MENIEQLWNWDMEWFMQLQKYILDNYGYDHQWYWWTYSWSPLPDASGYSDYILCYLDDWCFYTISWNNWIRIPNIKQFKPVSREEESRILASDPVKFWQVFIGSQNDGPMISYAGTAWNPATWELINLPFKNE